ncbi:MAG: hypothetical protein BGN88_10575 [Clostridiales bacterium 43-6]|nr:MAG: hypothetical protein BGN88_10575 [Clostridiales bacterium 43-6]
MCVIVGRSSETNGETKKKAQFSLSVIANQSADLVRQSVLHVIEAYCYHHKRYALPDHSSEWFMALAMTRVIEAQIFMQTLKKLIHFISIITQNILLII